MYNEILIPINEKQKKPNNKPWSYCCTKKSHEYYSNLEREDTLSFLKCILKKEKQKKQSYYLFKPIPILLHLKTENYFSMTEFASKR